MSRRKYDVVARIGEYQDREGNTKGRFQNVGAVIQTDNGHALILERWFNPAGLPNPDNRSGVLLSLFEPKAKDSTPAQQPSQQQPSPDPDDDIPF